MCDYSLHLVASRPARVGDQLVTTDFGNSTSTKGFTEAGGDPNVAVCLLPGTEVAFEEEVRYELPGFYLFRRRRVPHKVARFRQVDMENKYVHHDALEFPDGQIVLVTRLTRGQTAKVVQLPASASIKPIIVEEESGNFGFNDGLIGAPPMVETAMVGGTVPRRNRGIRV